MNYLHYEFDLASGDVVEVELDKQANVRLLDSSNYATYAKGQQHRYYGGLAQRSPARLAPPHPGHWHLVVDLGDYAGRVRASARVVRANGQ